MKKTAVNGVKTIFGISLGSSQRDHESMIEVGNTPVHLIRKGTNGHFPTAISLLKENDGKVDAFGLGGAVLYVQVKNKKYYFRQLKGIRAAVSKSKLVDGNGVKETLSRAAINAIERSGIKIENKKVLHVGAIDRYSQAKIFVENQCDIVFGDLMFGLGIPIPVKKLTTIDALGAVSLPIITKLPFRWFYPIGKEQDMLPNEKHKKYFENAEIIAGDFIWIKANMPPDLSGKIILTNTTTLSDMEELQRRKLKMLVTTTPRIDGRTYGTNIIEALLAAFIDKPVEEITPADYEKQIKRINLKPNIEILN